MKLDVYPDSVNYTCQVLKVSAIRKHPNADKLQIAALGGNNVICGLDTKVGDLVLFFPVESQLGEEFVVKNDLLRRKDTDGKPAGGLFEAHRRVRCIKLRDEYSEGYICSVGYLDTIGIDSSKLTVGDEFNTINGVEICRKYAPKTAKGNSDSTKVGKKPKKVESKLIDGQFHLHYDTTQLRKNLGHFAETDLIVITQKMHGSLAAMGKVLCKKPLIFKNKVAKFLGFDIQTTEYDYVYSSRTVVKNKSLNSNAGYYDHDIWTDAFERNREFIEDNITLYGELVGQLPNGKHIQKGYIYGTEPNNFDFYIYRITFTNIAGKVYDFSWQQIKNYCTKYGLKHVPELFYGRVSEFTAFAETLGRDVGYVLPEESHDFGDKLLMLLSNTYLEKKLPEGVPDEGVCIRNESKDFIAFKLKAKNFLGHETLMLDDGDVGVDDSENEISVE
jgi:hypothetical protein